MKNVLAAIVGAALAVAIAYVMWGRQVSELQQSNAQLQGEVTATVAKLSAATTAALKAPGKPRATTIMLKKDPNNIHLCTAEVEDQTIYGNQNRKVAWIVDNDEGDPCTPGGNFHLDLKFLPTDGTIPFPNEWVTLNRDVTAHRIKITGQSTTKKYKYEVYLVVGSTKTKMLDPDLEVEPPIRIITAAAPTTTTPAVTTPPAPAKKK